MSKRSALLLSACLLTSGALPADELRIVFSLYTPPYVFEDGTGIVVDIVRTALEERGHTVTPVYVPMERGLRLFSERKVDGNTIIQESLGLAGEYSADFMQYHNRAFALQARGLEIDSVDDLANPSVVAFQNADNYLGPEFRRAVAENSSYQEIARQESQVHMLLLGRIDVAIMDESIFRFYRQKLISEGKASAEQEFVAHELFPPTPYKAAFIDPAIRDDFDAGIAAIRADGRYEAIYRRYADRYFPVRE